MVPSSLRDEIVWRDGRPWVETHGNLRRSLCDQGQEPKSRLRGRVCEFQKWPLRAWEVENGLAAISEIRTPDPAFPKSYG
jgi:hypothetical protein